ncbi:MAG: DUF721 domain-containing protein [Planctomycetes bacterium]|nr:DUF721 domain-containing protein [Planctomycetota bacterium]
MTTPKHAGDLLRSILRDVGAKSERRRFVEALQTAVGEELAAHLQVLGFRRGRLFVQVDSAPLLAELRGFRAEEIREACNRQLAPEQIAEIVFRMEGTGHV